MVTAKICSSCGASNDLIFTNCMFCKSSLPQTDLNQISNDDLIMLAGEWVEKSKEGQLEIINLNATGVNKLLGSRKFMLRPEIIATAEKYLTLLAVRAINNPTLSILLQDLRSKLNSNRKKITNRTRLLIGVGIVGLILTVFVGNMASQEGKEENKEEAKLEHLVNEVNQSIKDKNYTYALTLTDQLVWQYEPASHDDKVQQWDKERKDLKESLENLQKAK